MLQVADDKIEQLRVQVESLKQSEEINQSKISCLRKQVCSFDY